MKKLLIITLLLIIQPIFSFSSDFIFITESGVQSLTGSTHEIVYDDTGGTFYHLSQLDWDQNIVLAGGKISLIYKNLLFTSYSFYNNLVYGDGQMIDYDWLANYDSSYIYTGHDASEWTHRSISNIQMSAKLINWILGIKSPKLFNFIKFDSGIGYKKEERYWTDKLQSLTYSIPNDPNGFRADKEIIYNIPGITYNVVIDFAYYTFGMIFEINNWSLKLYGEYSNLVDINSIDNHLIRALQFDDTMENYTYWGAGTNITWNINFKSFINFNINYNTILEGEPGDEIIWDEKNTSKYHYYNVAGFAQESLIISFIYGLKY